MSLMTRRRMMGVKTEEQLNIIWSSDAKHKIRNGVVQNLTKDDQYVSELVRVEKPTVFAIRATGSNTWSGAAIYDKNGTFIKENFSSVANKYVFMGRGYVRFAAYNAITNRNEMVSIDKSVKYAIVSSALSITPFAHIQTASASGRDICSTPISVNVGDVISAVTTGSYLMLGQYDIDGSLVKSVATGSATNGQQLATTIVDGVRYLVVKTYAPSAYSIAAVPNDLITWEKVG